MNDVVFPQQIIEHKTDKILDKMIGCALMLLHETWYAATAIRRIFPDMKSYENFILCVFLSSELLPVWDVDVRKQLEEVGIVSQKRP